MYLGAVEGADICWQKQPSRQRRFFRGVVPFSFCPRSGPSSDMQRSWEICFSSETLQRQRRRTIPEDVANDSEAGEDFTRQAGEATAIVDAKCQRLYAAYAERHERERSGVRLGNLSTMIKRMWRTIFGDR